MSGAARESATGAAWLSSNGGVPLGRRCRPYVKNKFLRDVGGLHCFYVNIAAEEGLAECACDE